MDWSALVGAISAAVVLAIGAAVKAALDMRKGQVEVRVAEHAAIRARRADAVAEWKALLDERDERIDRLDVKVGQLEQELADERTRSSECERRAALLNDRLCTVVHACRDAGLRIPEWDDSSDPARGA